MAEQDKDERRKGISRKQFIVGGAAAGAALGMGGAGAAAAPPKSADKPDPPPRGDEEIVLYNGRIHTMDGDNRVVSRRRIRERPLRAVGGHRLGRGRRVIDLRGRTVVPGIIDNHNHIVLMGNRPGYHTPLENAYSIARRPGDRRRRAPPGIPPGAWITTIGGFHRNHLVRPGGDAAPAHAARSSTRPCRTIRCTSRKASTGRRRRTASARSSSRARRRRFRSAPTARSPRQARRPRGARCCALRQTLLNAASSAGAAPSTRMAYGLSLGVTTHLDQGAFQATNTPGDGAAHEDNYTMQLPFLALHARGPAAGPRCGSTSSTRTRRPSCRR